MFNTKDTTVYFTAPLKGELTGSSHQFALVKRYCGLFVFVFKGLAPISGVKTVGIKSGKGPSLKDIQRLGEWGIKGQCKSGHGYPNTLGKWATTMDMMGIRE